MSNEPFSADKYLAKIATQYRESDLFLCLIDIFLEEQVELFSTFNQLGCKLYDCDNATDDQLDVIGNTVGLPRTICGVQNELYFGFDCGDCVVHVEDWCQGKWRCDPDTELKDFTFLNDTQYRKFIKARIISNASTGTIHDVVAVSDALFDSTSTVVINQNGLVAIYPGRPFTEAEFLLIELYRGILPRLPGIEIKFYLTEEPIFQFDTTVGDGWCIGNYGNLY